MRSGVSGRASLVQRNAPNVNVASYCGMLQHHAAHYAALMTPYKMLVTLSELPDEN
jgi:hypothetical protein